MSGISKETFAAINASLNGVSAVLLVAAFLFVKRRQYRRHAITMITAFMTSAVFLFFYVSSYLVHDERSSGLPPGWLRTVYLLILFPHILLAVGMLPMIGTAFWRAYRRQWERHHRVASPTFWIWLYVSVTGVVIYWMLYHLFPGLKG